MIQCRKHFTERIPVMYANCAYLYNSDIDINNHSKPLIVSSCGTYHLKSKPSQKTFRSNGRSDYQLLYIASGKAHFFFKGIEQIAHSRHMSTCWFIRSFRSLTGSTPLQYILAIRIANARALLEHAQYNVTEVAALVGFDDPLHFSHVFKKHTGVSPSKYRKD